jgi:lipoprotein signal peptidase
MTKHGCPFWWCYRPLGLSLMGSTLFFVLDRISKQHISSQLALNTVQPVWPGILQWHVTTNTGMAFSLLRQWPHGLTALTGCLIVLFICLACFKKHWKPLESGRGLFQFLRPGNLRRRSGFYRVTLSAFSGV